MKENYIDDTLFFKFENIDESKVKHLFSSRIGWNDENKLVNKVFATDKRTISLKQVHGKNVEIVDEDFLENYDEDKPIEGDGLLTSLDNIILKTYHADCTPLYFIDYKKNIVGVAHAGWKGTYENILSEMINNMLNVYSSSIDDIHLFIGPAIKSCCYEVGKDLFDKFMDKYDEYSGAFDIRDGKYYFDTQTINYNQALSSGILKENITKTKLCTACNVDRLYSYRKENGTKGRLITAITITD